MSNHSHQLPDDFNILSPEYFNQLMLSQERCESTCKDLASLEQLIGVLETTDPTMHHIAIEQFGMQDVISTEDANRNALQSWERVKLNLRRFQSDLFGYAKVIQSGAERLVERLEMLKNIAEKANKVPFKDQVRLKKNQKFALNGKFEPFDIRPVMESTNNTFDFYDKVLIPFLQQTDKLMSDVQPDMKFGETTQVNFDLFAASKWMKNFKPLEQPDDRFRASAYVVRGITAQGEKALYYSGPEEAEGEGEKDWSYFISNVRNMRLRYMKIPGQQPLNESDGKIDVESATTIRQRLSYLIGVAKRIAGRKGYDKKISAELRKLERSAEKMMNDARKLQTDLDRNQDKDEPVPEHTKLSVVVRDVSTVMTATTRLVQDFNNTMAGQLRLAGALGFVADLELKAYEAPLEKPDPEVKEKLDK